ncbi:GNAT family N-acetyltransferase [Neobacillus pocheonensis]|uniref:GNAT family N-acetyltransferase n=1 Tax=Neobacillus pocheonensis TaxID=363869 RepID=UPI003D292D0E
MNKIEIRSLQQIDELEDVRRLECEIWGEADSIPTHQTITAVKNGGLVLGAYDGERLVGFQYSFPGFNGKMTYLCSHVLATDVEYRNKKIGEKLKLAQRDEALKLGYSLITWTYDPLESINGYLNIAKLGGRVSTYIENCYGEMEDLLNNGIASDRFLVEWYIRDERPFEIEVASDCVISQSLIEWDMNHDCLPVPLSPLPLPQSEKTVYVPVPKAFRTIKETNLELAKEWRMKTREIYQHAFQQDWQITGFIKNSEPNVPVHFYVLTRR